MIWRDQIGSRVYTIERISSNQVSAFLALTNTAIDWDRLVRGRHNVDPSTRLDREIQASDPRQLSELVSCYYARKISISPMYQNEDVSTLGRPDI